MNKRAHRRLRAAGKARAYIRDIAASRWSKAEAVRHANRKLGAFGPASEVKHIDPNEDGPA